MATQKYNTDVVLTIDLEKAKRDLANLTTQIQQLNASSDSNERAVKALEKQWDMLNGAIKKAEESQKEMNTAQEEGTVSSEKLSTAMTKAERPFTTATSSVKKLSGAFKGLVGINLAGIFARLGREILNANGALDKLESAWKRSAVYQTLFKTDDKSREEASKATLKASQEELASAQEMADEYETSLLPLEDQKNKLLEQQTKNATKLANVEKLLKNKDLTLAQRNELQASKNTYLAEELKLKTKINQIDEDIADAAEKGNKSGSPAPKKETPKETDPAKLYAELSKLENSMTNQFLDETEKRIQAAYDEESARQDVIDKLLEAGIISEERKTELYTQAAENRQTILDQIEAEAERKRKEAAEKAREEDEAAERAALEAKKQMQQEALNATVNVLDAIAEVTAQGGEKAFEVQKGAQIASAMVTGLSGAAGAYAQAAATIAPPAGEIIGAANAASVIATTMARIASIKKQKYNNPNEGTGGVTQSTDSSAASMSSGTTSVSQAIISRNVSPAARDSQQKIQTVLVVDDVTNKQMQQEQINKVSVI